MEVLMGISWENMEKSWYMEVHSWENHRAGGFSNTPSMAIPMGKIMINHEVPVPVFRQTRI